MIPEDWFDATLPHLPGADRTFVEQLILQVTADFCRQTDVWAEWLDPIDIEAGQAIYDPVPPNDTGIARVYAVKISDQFLPPRNRIDSMRGLTGYYWSPDMGLRINPVPSRNIDRGLSVFASLWPKTTDVFPYTLLGRWQHVIVHGVLGRAMATPQRGYSNPQLAPYHLREWQSGVATARFEARRGYTTMTEFVVPPRVNL